MKKIRIINFRKISGIGTVERFYAFSFFKDFVFFSAVLVPFFTRWGNISQAQVQLLQSWFMLWFFLMEIPTGVVADFIGRKFSMALGAFTVVLATLVYGSIPRFEVFLIGEFLFATALALMSGADTALIYDQLKQEGRENESKRILGKAHAVYLLGIFFAAPIGGLIGQKFGLNAPMLFSSLPLLLAGCIALSITEPKRFVHTSESVRYIDIAKKGFSYLLRHKMLKLLALDGIIVASASYFLIWLYQPLLIRLLIPIQYFGWFHALMVGVEILVTSNFVRLEQLAGSGKRYFKYTALLTSISFLLVAIFPHIVTAVGFIICVGGFGLTRLELMNSYLNKYIPSEERATILSSISMFRRFALVLLNPLIGITADYSLQLSLFIVGLLPLLSLFFSPLENE